MTKAWNGLYVYYRIDRALHRDMSDAHHALSTTSRVRPRPHYILGLLLPAATTLVVTLRPATVAGFQQASSSRVRCNHYLTHGLSATSAVRLSRESATSASLSYVMGTIKMMSLNSFQQQPCLDDGNGSNGELGMEGSSRCVSVYKPKTIIRLGLFCRMFLLVHVQARTTQK